MRSLYISAAAEKQLRDFAGFIAENNPPIARAFLVEMRAAFSELQRMPELGIRMIIRDVECRKWKARRFPNHLIFYVIEPEKVVIFEIVHGASDY